MNENKRNDWDSYPTVRCFNTLAKYRIPVWVILFPLKFKVVRAYIELDKCLSVRPKFPANRTLLYCKASAKCCAPSLRMSFHVRYSSVKVHIQSKMYRWVSSFPDLCGRLSWFSILINCFQWLCAQIRQFFSPTLRLLSFIELVFSLVSFIHPVFLLVSFVNPVFLLVWPLMMTHQCSFDPPYWLIDV